MPGLGGITLGQSASLFQPPYVAGRWYASSDEVTAPGGTIAPGLNTLRLCVVSIPRPITISDIGSRITTLSIAGNIQLGLYAADPVTNLPSSLPIATTANIATDSVGAVSADIAGADVMLVPGLYWFGVMADNAVVVVAGSAPGVPRMARFVGSTTLANVASNVPGITYTSAVTYGTWPNLTSSPPTEAAGVAEPYLVFKVSVGG